jgi:hypothetical protein
LPFCPHSKHVIPCGIRLLKSNWIPFKLMVLLLIPWPQVPPKCCAW